MTVEKTGHGRNGLCFGKFGAGHRLVIILIKAKSPENSTYSKPMRLINSPRNDQRGIAMRAALIAFLLSIASQAEATEFLLYTEDNQFLGCWRCGQYNSDSICNEYGSHGSEYNSNSIWNEYGTYGSEIFPVKARGMNILPARPNYLTQGATITAGFQ